MSSTSYNSSPSLPPPPPRSPVIQKKYVNVNQPNGSASRNVGAAATSSSRSSNGKNSNANHSRYRSSSSTTNRSSSSNYPNRNNNSISSVDPTRTNPLSTAALATALSNATEVRFSNHGKYISRHPIRVLLLCSLVITSLFYPAVGIYFWSSKGGPGVTRGDAASVWKSLSTPFMDSFISGREHHNSIRDLRMIWDDSNDLKALDIRDYDKFGTATSSGGGRSKKKSKSKSSSRISSSSTSSSDSEARIDTGSNNDEKGSNGNCRTIRIEHIFVTADDILKGSGPKHGVLQIPILSSALQLQQTIESATSSWSSTLESPPHRIEESQELLSSNSNSTPTSSPRITSSSSSSSHSHSSFHSSLQCIMASSSSSQQSSKEPKCLTLSPLDYFNGSLSYLKSIESPERIPLISDLNQTMSGIPLSIATTLAGRWHLFSKLPRAEHLAFTFFLEVEEQGGDGEDCFSSSRNDDKASKKKDHQDEDLENSDYYLDLNQGRKSLSSSSSTLVSEPTSDRSRTNGNGGSIYGNGAKHFNERNDGLSQQHSDWMKMLRNVTNGQVRIIPSEHTKAKELLLHFTPKHPSAGLPFPQLFLSFAYLFVLIYIIRGLINTRRVHSRFGIAFTGAMELLISMIMSISLCGLLGIRLNLVPFEILPFVIVVIGSENMSVLIDAIVNTPVSLNVPSRISKGLRKVGVSISVTVISDIVLLGIIANVVMVDAVREFCIFAIFSLVMDYFMQMTFFITVLSIDMQRLELADLLSQGEGGSNSRELSSNDVNSTSNRKAKKSNNSSNQPPTSSSFIKTSCRAVWRARTARTASLSLMLALLFGLYLYYGTGYPMLKNYSFTEGQQEVPSWIQSNNEDPSSVSSSIGSFTSSPPISKNSFDPLSHLSPNSVQSDMLPWWSSSPSANFWKALNPSGSPQIKVIIEPWTILSLRAPNSRIEKQISFAGWALFRPRIRAFIWFAKLVVLPIAGTTGLLWGLLLYLLKDTEILEAQFDKDEADTDLGSDLDEGNGNQEGCEDESFESKTDSDRIFDLNISKNSHFNDVEILSESNGMIFSKDLDGNFGIWRSLKKKFERFNLQFDNNFQTGEGLNSGNTITSLSCDSKAKVLAIGKNDGKVLLLNSTNLKPFWSAFRDYASTSNGNLNGNNRNNNNQLGLNPSVGLPTSRVQHLFKHFRNSFLEKSQSVSFLSCHRDGSAWEWLPGGGSPQLRIPSRSHCNWNAFEVDGINGTNSDGRFQREEERGSFDDGGSERNEKAFESRELIAMTTTPTNLSEKTNRLEIYERDVGDEIWKLKLSIGPDQGSKSDSNGNTRASAQFKCAAIFEMETTALPSKNPINSDQVRQNSTSTLKASGSEETNGDVTDGSSSPKNAQSSSSIENNLDQSNIGSEDTNTVSPISNPFDTSNDDSFDDNSSSTSPSTLTLSPMNRLTELLATGDSSGKVSILDFSSGTLLDEIQLNDGSVNKIRVVNEFQRVGSFSERNGCLLVVGTENKTWILQVGSSPSAFLPFGSENFLSSNSGHSRKASNLESSNSSSENGISPTNSPPRYSNGLPQENGGGLSSSSSNGSKRPSSPRQPKVSLPQTGSNFLSANTNLTLNQSSSSNSIPPPPRSPGGRDSRDSQLGHSRSTSHQSNSTSSEYHPVDTSHSKVAGLNSNSTNSTNSNLLSFPLSSHGSSRRRLSAQSGGNGGRSRSFVGEFNERGKLLDEEVFSNSGSTKNQNVNEKGALTLRSLGFISTSRGGFDLIQDSILIGVRRSGSNLFGNGSASGSPLLNGVGSGGSRLRKRNSNIELSVMGEKWQAWTLDLRNDLDSINSVSTSMSSGSSFSSYSRGISRELLVKSQGLNLNGKERLKSNFNVVGSLSESSRQLRSRRSNPFSSDFNQVHQRKEDFTENLSFNRLKPITRTNGKSNDSLLFGFGNSIARLSIKEEELDRRKGSITKSNALSAMSRR